MDVKPPSPEKTQTQSQPSAPPSVPTLLLPDTSLPDINSHPSLVASDVHSRRVCVCPAGLRFEWDQVKLTRLTRGSDLASCLLAEDGAEEETSVGQLLHLQEHVAHPDSVPIPDAEASDWAGGLPVLRLLAPPLQEQWRLQQRDDNGRR